MRKNWRNNIVKLLVLLLPVTFTACDEKHNHTGEVAEAISTLEYTCPMHPQIAQDKPGSCPICSMTLVAKQITTGSTIAVSPDLNYLLQPTNQTVISDIKTTHPVEKQVQNEISMSGVVSYDTRRQYIIPARFGGRIEKLYVQFNYQPVHKGQKLYDIYSPELVTAQKELIYLLQNDSTNKALIQVAKQKLQLLGATSDQVNRLVRAGQETYTFSVYSPYSGYVLDPAITVAPASALTPTTAATGNNGMGMGNTRTNSGNMGGGSCSAGATLSNGFAIREGMYVTVGQALLKVIDASQVWAVFNVASDQATQINPGTSISITSSQIPGDTLISKVILTEPVYEAEENFAQVRASLPTQNRSILIGQLITGKASINKGTALWIPKEAVLDIGTQAVVFQKINKVFKPKSIQVGSRAKNLVEVLSGLNTPDLIAANAQFLIDSESFIRIAEE